MNKPTKIKEFAQTLKNIKIDTSIKETQNIQAVAGYNYVLDVDISELDIEKVDDDLQLTFENGGVIIFVNYFIVNETELLCLISIPDDNGMYYYITENEYGEMLAGHNNLDLDVMIADGSLII